MECLQAPLRTPPSPDRSRLVPLVLDYTRLSRSKSNREPVRRLADGGWVVLFQLALIWNFFSRSLPRQDFFFSSFSCLLESGGLYCCNLNLDTRHNHDHCLYRISFFRALVACSSRGDSTVAILILILATITITASTGFLFFEL